ncbi:MAG: hypothetical protein JWR26_4317 [Pedosphaera sp.]|nr:hypothetical protein [Pedosphaera sp.]
MNVQETPLKRDPEPQPMPQTLPGQRYVPLLVWMIVVLALLLIPFKIISYGFQPGGPLDGLKFWAA